MLNSYQTVLLDLDGTLVDERDASRDASVIWSTKIGRTPDPERWLRIEKNWFLTFERGEVSYLGQRRERVREYLNDPGLDEATALQLFDGFLTHYLAAMRPIEHAQDLLQWCFAQGKTVGIATNGGSVLQTEKLKTTGLWDDRLIIIAAAELGVAKPDQEFYAQALSLTNAITADTIMVGDSLPNDVLGPLSAGITAIHLDRQRTSTPDARYTTVHDLAALL